MSRRKKEILIDDEFAKRFKEVCGTSKPTEIKNRFGFSYQAAKNYLKGNYPETSVLLSIARETNYSIHWLLTGEGDKFLSDEPSKYVSSENTIEVESLIRKIFLEEVAKFLVLKSDSREAIEINQQFTAKLSRKQILEEKLKLEEKKTLEKKN